MRIPCVLPALLLCACALDVDEPPEVGTIESQLGTGLHTIYNFNGDARYVKVTDREVKLYLSTNALADDNPKAGFRDNNDYNNSCGPTAAMNVFHWYGIDEREGKHCFWMHESPADLEGGIAPPPQWVCQPNVSPSRLGMAMQTNTWRMATVTMPGTSTENFRTVFRGYIDRYLPENPDLEYQYRYEEGDGLTQYKILWATLAQGNPIVVNYKTGATKGHFATIVGMEKVGNDNDINNDKIIMANARKEDLHQAISYGKFRQLWRRDYYDFGALALVGERRYTRINLWDTTEQWPVTGGGRPRGPGGPYVLK